MSRRPPTSSRSILRAILTAFLLLFLTSSVRYTQSYTIQAKLYAPPPSAALRVTKPTRFRDHQAYSNIRSMSMCQASRSRSVFPTSAASASVCCQMPSTNLAANSSAGQAGAPSTATVQPASVPVKASEKQQTHKADRVTQENQEIIKAQRLLISKHHLADNTAHNSELSFFSPERQEADAHCNG